MSNASREQLEYMLQSIETNPHQHWDMEYLRDLLGPEDYGRLLGIEQWWWEQNGDWVEQARQSLKPPAKVGAYLIDLNLHLHTASYQVTKVKNLKKQISALVYQLNIIESQLGDRMERLWATFDGFTSDDRKWCGCEASDRQIEDMPKVFDKAPLSVICGNEPGPTNFALDIILTKLLETT